MGCASCGAKNAPAAKFCKGCGTALSFTCPGCGATPPLDARFCDECGRSLVRGAAGTGALPLLEPIPGHPPTSPVSERRWVSVLFCDLVGFTAISEQRDAEEVRELLSSYFETARAVIERYGGVVEKFIGDAVMAAWGVPTANGDDAERAVRAALDLVAAVEKLGADLGVPALIARAGVLSGEAAVTLRAEGQGMVAGDLVNTASRLQSAAGAGQVLCGAATYLAARDAVAFEEVGGLSLKGKAEPVQAWLALRVVARRKGVGRSEALEPPFVGRERELGLLIDLLRATERDRTVRLVSVTGIAGIGKSRLAWELSKHVDGLAHEVFWHEGRCPAYGERVTFWALAEMVRMRADISEGEEDETARRKLFDCLAGFVAEEEERLWIEPRLAYLLGLGEAPTGDHQELMSAWRTFFERIAERAPVVMVFEDLHWADTGLLEYVESVAEWSGDLPILLISLARPEFKERRPLWGSTVGNFTALHLGALTGSAMQELVGGLVPSLAPTATDRIVERVEGVPLFAVETVRALSDRGVLKRSGGAYEVCAEPDDVQLPETLHLLIASRLDALGSRARTLVLDAAVLGKTFYPSALAAVSGIPESALVGLLRELVHREVFALNGDPRSPERGQYGFLQSVVREVAYATLARPDRRVKHLAAARHFESLGDEELAGVVASHYLECYRASRQSGEKDEVAAKTRQWLGAACRRARSFGACEEALVFVEQALEISEPGSERACLLELAGETALDAAEHERALGYLEEAARFYERADDAVGQGEVTSWITFTLDALGRYGEAIERAETAFSMLDSVKGAVADEARAKLAVRLSRCYRFSGDPTRGLSWGEQALSYAERLGDPELLAQALDARTASLYNVGRHDEAVVLVGSAFELAVAAGSLRQQAEAKSRQASFVHEDDPQRAPGTFLEVAELARRAGVRDRELASMLNAAELAIDVGEWELARRTLHDLGERRLPETWRLFWRCYVALLDGLSEDPATALHTLTEARAQVEATEYIDLRASYHRARAFVHLAALDLDDAFNDAAAVVALDPSGINSAHALSVQAHAALWRRDLARAEEALAGMGNFQGRWMKAARRTTEAGVAALTGREEAACSIYREAVEAWRQLRTPLDLALCGLDAAFVLTTPAALSELGAEARELLAGMGAAPLLDLLEKGTPR